MLIILWSSYDVVKQFTNKYNRTALSVLSFFIGCFIGGVGNWTTEELVKVVLCVYVYVWVCSSKHIDTSSAYM
jgi:hypothetical protein